MKFQERVRSQMQFGNERERKFELQLGNEKKKNSSHFVWFVYFVVGSLSVGFASLYPPLRLYASFFVSFVAPSPRPFPQKGLGRAGCYANPARVTMPHKSLS